MPGRSVTKDLPNLVPTSSGSSTTNAIGGFDDAIALMIFVASSAGTASTGASAPLKIIVSPADLSLSTQFQTGSTAMFTYAFTTTLAGIPVLTTGQCYTISPVPFRSLALTNMTSAVASEVIARVTAQIRV